MKNNNPKSMIILAAILLCAAIASIAAAAAASADSSPLPSLTGVTLSPDGVLSWDPFPGAAGYEYCVGTGGGIVTDENHNPVTFINLKEQADSFHFASGTLDWYVYAFDENRVRISEYTKGTYEYVNTQIPLAAPGNVHWDHATAVWDPVEYAESYFVGLYRYNPEGGENVWVVSNFVYGVTAFDFSEYLETGKTYTFRVYAEAHYTDFVHTDSAEVVSPEKAVVAVQPSLTGVSINDNLLTFDPVPGCEIICVYAEGAIQKFTSQPVDMNEFLPPEHPAGSSPVRLWAANAYGEPLVPRYALEWTYGAATAPETEPVTEPETEPVTEPETEPVTEPETEPVTEPETEPVTEPETEPVTEPETEPVTEPKTEPVTEPETEPVTESETEPVTEPETEPVTEPETEPVTEPETEPVTEPETEPVTESETLPVADQSSDTEGTSASEPDTSAETGGADETTAEEPLPDSPETGSTEETTPQTDVNTAMIGEPEGLSGGAIAAIVAGSVLVLGAGGFILYKFVFGKKQ